VLAVAGRRVTCLAGWLRSLLRAPSSLKSQVARLLCGGRSTRCVASKINDILVPNLTLFGNDSVAIEKIMSTGESFTTNRVRTQRVA